MIQYTPMFEDGTILDTEMFERALPPYLAHDLEAYKKAYPNYPLKRE